MYMLAHPYAVILTVTHEKPAVDAFAVLTFLRAVPRKAAFAKLVVSSLPSPVTVKMTAELKMELFTLLMDAVRTQRAGD